MGGQEKRKDRKTHKSRGEEKGVGFSSTSLFPARKREAVTQDGTRGIDHPNPEPEVLKTQAASNVKGWQDK